jgi:hypothetical protein
MTTSYFTPENLDMARSKEHLSPSGKYRLVVTPVQTKPGCWNYSQGLVYAVGNDTAIADFQRNYSSFPFLWVEDHVNGHSYVVGGEDYQGQTVIELDTGKRRDHLPPEAKEGHGFCWVGMKFRAEGSVLVVDGCYWACPYEFRFYDFSDPMAGWPQIGEGTWIDNDRREPTFNDDGTITCYQTEYNEDAEDEDEDGNLVLQPVAAKTTYRREGLALVQVEEWVSEKELKIRADRVEWQRKDDEWRKNFKDSDPLYLVATELMKDSAFTPADYCSIGITHDKWCPDFTGKEKRWCHRIASKGEYTLDLEWAVETGPIKLGIYKGGKHVEDKFFMEHSAASMGVAFAYVKGLLTGESCPA